MVGLWATSLLTPLLSRMLMQAFALAKSLLSLPPQWLRSFTKGSSSGPPLEAQNGCCWILWSLFMALSKALCEMRENSAHIQAHTCTHATWPGTDFPWSSAHLSSPGQRPHRGHSAGGWQGPRPTRRKASPSGSLWPLGLSCHALL